MATTCYFPSGDNTAISGSTYIPCNQTAVANGEHSACCAPNDMCFTNGLCKAGPDNWNWNWRIGCTDRTWQAPACPNYCRGIGRDDQAHLIFQCQNDGTWCCSTGDPAPFVRNFNFTCCNISNLSFKATGAEVYTHASVNLALTTLVTSNFSSSPTTSYQPQLATQSKSDVTASTTESFTQTALSPSNTATGSKPTALPIGLGVGIPLAIILIAVACFASWRLGRRQTEQAYAQVKKNQAKECSMSEGGYSMQEMGGDTLRAEMPYRNSPVELEGPTKSSASYRPSTKQPGGMELF